MFRHNLSNLTCDAAAALAIAQKHQGFATGDSAAGQIALNKWTFLAAKHRQMGFRLHTLGRHGQPHVLAHRQDSGNDCMRLRVV
jgi:hypothetical protein